MDNGTTPAKSKRVFTPEQLARRKVTAAAYRAKRKATGVKPKPLTQAQKDRLKKTGAKWYAANKYRVRAKRAENPKNKNRVRPPMTPEQRARKREMEALRYLRTRDSNSERRKKSTKAWQDRNQLRHKANYAKWAARNREKRNRDHCAWMVAHPEVRRKFQMKRRALEKNAEVGDVELIAEWEKKWRRSPRVRCYWCLGYFSGKRMHLDHIIALARGGKHSIENVCTSCQPCNNSKKSKTVEQWNSNIAEPVLL